MKYKDGSRIIIYKKKKFQRKYDSKEILQLLKYPKDFSMEKKFIRGSIILLNKMVIKIIMVKTDNQSDGSWLLKQLIIILNEKIIKYETPIFA